MWVWVGFWVVLYGIDWFVFDVDVIVRVVKEGGVCFYDMIG